ncbi:MAG: hypothetical protein Q9220_007399 [cf. Caloplaca sp. 1 TL-2023]
MSLLHIILLFPYFLLPILHAHYLNKPIPSTLNVTTITANTQKQSVIECWQLISPLVPTSVGGLAGGAFAQLGDAGNVSWGIIPPRTDGGLHNAPVVQFVGCLAGESVVTIPNSTQTVTIRGNRNGLVLAADIKDLSILGHRSVYASDRQTVIVQIPVAGNRVPAHRILHGGACLERMELL